MPTDAPPAPPAAPQGLFAFFILELLSDSFEPDAKLKNKSAVKPQPNDSENNTNDLTEDAIEGQPGCDSEPSMPTVSGYPECSRANPLLIFGQ